MVTLALECSGKSASIAIYDGEKPLAFTMENAGRTHAETLMPMVDYVLSATGKTLDGVDKIAVTIGPGAFTGLRVGVATAIGLALGANIPIAPVSTMEALAHQAFSTAREGEVICTASDARREQVYNALFAVQGGNLVRLIDDRAIGIEDLLADMPQDVHYVLIGDGAHLITSPNHDFIRLSPHLTLPNAHGVALATQHITGIDPCDVTPNYIRTP